MLTGPNRYLLEVLEAVPGRGGDAGGPGVVLEALEVVLELGGL